MSVAKLKEAHEAVREWQKRDEAFAKATKALADCKLTIGSVSLALHHSGGVGLAVAGFGEVSLSTEHRRKLLLWLIADSNARGEVLEANNG